MWCLSIISRFGVGTGPQHWSVTGFSSGGTCAVDLTVMHPELFGRFRRHRRRRAPPGQAPRRKRFDRLFGGDRQASADVQPRSQSLAAHGRYVDTAGLFMVPEASAHSDSEAGAPTVRRRALPHGIR